MGPSPVDQGSGSGVGAGVSRWGVARRGLARRGLALLCLAVCWSPVRGQAEPPEPASAVEPSDEEGERLPEVILLLRDGRRLEGVLVEENADGAVTLRVGRIDTTFEARQVDRVLVLPPVRARYEQMRGAVPDDDTERLLVLVEWLRGHGELVLALVELESILEREPDHPDAQRLNREVRAELALRELRRSPIEGPDLGGGAEPPAEFPLLTPDQINLLKVFEIDLSRPPKLEVSRETIDRLIERYPGSPVVPTTPEGRQALYRKPAADIVDRLFRIQARDLYPEIRVTGDPDAFARFRQDIHAGWLITGCATSSCHGGQAAGRLWLHNKHRASEATVYTNFLILDRWRLGDEESTPLINYDDPASSPLLQMGLPRDRSLFPHPEVSTGPGSAWKPIFRATDDVRYQRAVEWIRSMYTPRPEYPIEYSPPVPADDGAALPPVEGRRPR